jgi:hypothetical protein
MNNTERLLYQKHHLSDEERNQVLKLINCALSTREIADIMHISASTVCYIRQAHTACIDKDWNTLQRLSTSCAKASVDWAMRVTGTDKAFLETFGKPVDKSEEPHEVAEAGKIVDAPVIDQRNLYEMFEVMCDIRRLLTEIRDTLK